MTDRFTECLEHVLMYEGGYVNHPADRGGATKWGVTQRTYDAYRRNKGFPVAPVKDMSRDEMRAIYRESYWDTIKGDNLPEPVDMVTFDAAVNSGVARSAKWIQRLVGADEDGKLGPKSLAKLAEYVRINGATNTARDLIELRAEFLADVVENDPSQLVFKRGWDNRLASLATSIAGVV